MRINYDNFRCHRCAKCARYTGTKPVFGKCVAGRSEIHECARRMMAEKPVKGEE